MVEVRGAAAAGHGKSGAPLTRGCFLLVLMTTMVTLVEETRALTTSRQSDPALGVLNVRFRGARAAFMPPTATSLSAPVRNNNNNNNNAGRRPVSFGGGSISSSLMPPGVASRAPATRTQEAGPEVPALTPQPQAPRSHTWASGIGSSPQKPAFVGFGGDGVSEPRPAMWARPQESAPARKVGQGWAGMDGPAVQGRRAAWAGMVHPRAHLTEGPDTQPGRPDTFGLDITEDLSHLNDRPSERWQPGPRGRFSSSGEGRIRGRGPTRTAFGGGFRHSLRPTVEEEEDEMVVEDEGLRNIFDFNATTEYHREDYLTYHDYDQGNHSWRSSSPTHDHKPLTFEHVKEIMSLPSQADLHALLDQRNITFDELRAFLNSGARKKDVLEFLKPPPPIIPVITTTTTTSPPELPQHAHDASVVEEGYQDDVREGVSPSEVDHEGEGDDNVPDSKEQTRRNRKKGRRGKGRRKNKKRKGKKGGREDVPEISPSLIPPVDYTTSTTDPEPWAPSTPETLPEVILATITAATGDTLLPTTPTPPPDVMLTSPLSVRTSEVSIVSVTLVEAPSDPPHKTFVEDATHTRRHNTPSTTHPRHEPTPTKFPRPARPSREPGQTVNEIEKVNFVREEQRDDYVFPLRGLLIISGLMGALAVFTLVVLISYAVIKCSKKPVVNNYQVSEQQKPAGT